MIIHKYTGIIRRENTAGLNYGKIPFEDTTNPNKFRYLYN